MIDNEKNIAFWDRAAQRSRTGKEALAGMLMDGKEFEALYRCRSEQEHLLRIFNPTKGGRILEIGSGGGRWGFWFADRVGAYVGIDLSPSMVEIAKAERTRRNLSNVRFECVNMLDFEDDAGFDLIYFSGVLQYMDDTIIRRCIEKAASLLSVKGVIISRDTVQKTERVEKSGAYPVVYRTALEYIAFFKEAGYHLEYSEVSYPHKRFTNLAAHFYELPGVTYGLAYALREALCRIDDAFGNPYFLKTHKHRELMQVPNPQEHRFFKYVGKS